MVRKHIRLDLKGIRLIVRQSGKFGNRKRRIKGKIVRNRGFVKNSQMIIVRIVGNSKK